MTGQSFHDRAVTAGAVWGPADPLSWSEWSHKTREIFLQIENPMGHYSKSSTIILGNFPTHPEKPTVNGALGTET